MSKEKDKSLNLNSLILTEQKNSSPKNDSENKKSQQEKGPSSFFLGALTSLLLAWVSLLLTEKVVIYFTIHAPQYSSPIAQSISSGLKTLIIGMCCLATFSFAFIGLGLVIVFIRSFFNANRVEGD